MCHKYNYICESNYTYIYMQIYVCLMKHLLSRFFLALRVENH